MPTTNSGRFNKKSQCKIFKMYGNRCVHCGKQFPYEKLTRDHIIPASYGGSCAWTNIVPACYPCNALRHNYVIKADWRDALQEKAKDCLDKIVAEKHAEDQETRRKARNRKRQALKRRAKWSRHASNTH